MVITAARYMEVRAALKDQMLSRLELRLGDVMDSEFDRKVAANVPTGMPGRGQVPEKLHFLAAQPRIDGEHDPEDLSQATAAFVSAVKQHWSGGRGPGRTAAAAAAARGPAAQGRGAPRRRAVDRHRRDGAGAGVHRLRHRSVPARLR
ncbi:hypothetical protein GCM10020254_26440 [Streptomyces goshikiensis]